jgi:prolyl-tRNA synthetase
VRWSKLFIPTLRELPAEGTVAEKWLARAGYARAMSTGVYGWLPLGQRALEKLRRAARAELEAIGGQEVELTEGAASAIAAGELRSAKLLPQVWYRFESGPMRARELKGLEVFSFGGSEAVIVRRLSAVLDRARMIFKNSGDAFCWPSESGLDLAVVCNPCRGIGSARNALTRPSAPPPDPESDLSPEEFHTPGQKTIADLSRFTGLPESAQMKSLVLVANGKPILVMLRGDHQLNEEKFAAKSDDPKFRQATAEEIGKWMGASAGSLGPVGVKTMPILADNALAERRHMICGANRDDYHLRHVTPGEDFDAEFCDLREVMPGDTCVRCGGPLQFQAVTEVARWAGGVFRLSLERVLTCVAETGIDKDGLILPPPMAPFDVVISAAIVSDASETIYRNCLAAGVDVLYDDRDERPGVKFKDADLIGVPLRINVGKKLAEGKVEVVERITKEVTDVAVDEVVDVCRAGRSA